ncbi:fucose permease [Arthrobacter alpinus]|uniref:MFS transporter n=1 Tax=Arthrobacter alpinus TaxID=656366 RepID=UPI0005CA12EA|nr:MFS transporter [Arthrobacter alpinus]ALV45578.1 fucose permease [Arthrobacter alpinus]
MSLKTAESPALPVHLRRARWAVAALFFTNGALFANLLPRFPAIKEALGLSNAEFGFAVAAYPLGALSAGLAAGLLIRRFGSAKVAVAGTLGTALGLVIAGITPTGILFATALLLAGAFDAITDVAQNSHGLRVQRLYSRSILNSFHAVWSIGAVTGGLMGAAAAGLQIPLWLHLLVSGVLFAAVSLGSLRFLLRGADSPEPVAGGHGAIAPRSAAGLGKYLVILALVVIAAGSTLVEDAGSTWAAVYLSGDFGAGASVAGLGFVALVGAQFIGRLVGDSLVDRFGQRLVAQAGGVIVALGMGQALLFPSVPGTIAGFALAGFGVSTLVPAAMHAADNLPGLREGTGLSIVSWLMRVSFLLSPPIVGAVADATSLRTGLLVVPLAGLLVVLLSPVLTTRADTPEEQTRRGDFCD